MCGTAILPVGASVGAPRASTQTPGRLVSQRHGNSGPDHKDVTPSGIHDLGGNLSEWCLDEYQELLFGDKPQAVNWDPRGIDAGSVAGIQGQDCALDKIFSPRHAGSEKSRG